MRNYRGRNGDDDKIFTKKHIIEKDKKQSLKIYCAWREPYRHRFYPEFSPSQSAKRAIHWGKSNNNPQSNNLKGYRYFFP